MARKKASSPAIELPEADTAPLGPQSEIALAIPHLASDGPEEVSGSEAAVPDSTVVLSSPAGAESGESAVSTEGASREAGTTESIADVAAMSGESIADVAAMSGESTADVAVTREVGPSVSEVAASKADKSAEERAAKEGASAGVTIESIQTIRAGLDLAVNAGPDLTVGAGSDLAVNAGPDLTVGAGSEADEKLSAAPSTSAAVGGDVEVVEDEDETPSPVNYDDEGLTEVTLDEALYRFDAGKQGTAVCLSMRSTGSWKWRFLGELRWDGRTLRSRQLERRLLERLSVALREYSAVAE